MSGPRIRRRLVLETQVAAPDGLGGRSLTWAALGTVWADMAPARGRADKVAERTASRQPWRITVRGAPTGSPQRPHPAQRFREGTRIFHILSVAEADPAGRYLICRADEGVLA